MDSPHNKKKFSHAGKNYILRHADVGDYIVVRVFNEDGTPADCIEFRAASDVRCDEEAEGDTLKELFEAAENYVRRGTWCEVEQALTELKDELD